MSHRRDDYPVRQLKEGEEEEVMELSKDEVAFVLGRQGSTKRKIERVASCNLDLRNQTLTMQGSRESIDRAKDYTRFILQQRVGDVCIDFEETRADLTIVEVPQDSVGFVMGRGGKVLRSLEEQWGTLMFFAKRRGSKSGPRTDEAEKLAIFGPRTGRRGAELKVMSAVEHKHKGWFCADDGESLKKPLAMIPGAPEWGFQTRVLRKDEFSYALGGGGSTRKKLAAASGCILEFVGSIAIMAVSVYFSFHRMTEYSSLI